MKLINPSVRLLAPLICSLPLVARERIDRRSKDVCIQSLRFYLERGKRERERLSVDKYVRIIQPVIGSTGADPKNKNHGADSFAIRGEAADVIFMKTLYLPGCWRRSKRKIVYAWFCTEAGEISSGPPVYSFLTFSIKLCMKSARALQHTPLDHEQRI